MHSIEFVDNGFDMDRRRVFRAYLDFKYGIADITSTVDFRLIGIYLNGIQLPAGISRSLIIDEFAKVKLQTKVIYRNEQDLAIAGNGAAQHLREEVAAPISITSSQLLVATPVARSYTPASVAIVAISRSDSDIDSLTSSSSQRTEPGRRFS